MDASDPTLDPNRLAAQTEWLRRLARRLVSDADAAEDVVQETMLAALERPPLHAASDGGLRAWMQAVARNIARMRRRSDGRRSARESDYAASRPGTAPPSDDVVVRTTEARRLIDAVLTLDEPYRRAVLLAYEERLPSREIAARTGVTPETARKRVSRGLAQLRERLASNDDGTGRSWLAGLAVLAREPQLAAPLGAAAWAGGSIVSLKIAGSVAACALLIALGVVFTKGDTPQVPDAGLASVANSIDEVELAGTDDGQPEDVETGDARRAEEKTEDTLVEAAAPRRIQGRFVLSDGLTPVAGAQIRATIDETGTTLHVPPGIVLGETDDQGYFDLTLEDDEHVAAGLWAEHPDVYDVHVDPSDLPATEDDFLVIQTVALGSVLVHARTEDGAPLADVAIEYMIDPTIGSDKQLWSYRGDRYAGRTDANGDLLVTGLPVAMPIRFGLKGEWAKPGRTSIDPVAREAEVVVTPHPWCAILARLEWPDGSPATDVGVVWHGTSGRSGTFGGTRASVDANGQMQVSDVSSGGGVLLFERGGFHAPIHLRLEPGQVSDLGVLTLERNVVVAGEVVMDGGGELPTRTGVAAFRDGALVAYQRLEDGERTFSLNVPSGPVVLAAVIGVDWDPEMPYRGSSLGELLVDAPRDDVELRVDAPRATVIGKVEGVSGDVDVIAFGPEPSVDWGTPRAIEGAYRTVALEADGTFRCDFAPAASARLLVMLDDGRTAYTPIVSLNAGAEVDLGTLDPTPGRLATRASALGDEPVEGVVVHTMAYRRKEQTARTGQDGVATIELPAGPYGVRAEGDAGTSGAWQLVHVEAGELAEATLAMAGVGLFDGIVVSPDGPMEGVSIKTQRESPPTNLSWSATTGADGRFAFQPLMPGVYRYWISGHLVGRVELVPGEPTDMTLKIDGTPQVVELRSGGEPLTFAESLLVTTIGDGPQVWTRGERLAGGRFRVALPEGDLLFQIDFGGLGNNQIALIPGPPASGGDEYALDLPETGIEVRFEGASLHRPRPAAFFLDLNGETLVSSWGDGSEVYAEDVSDPSAGGIRTLRFPFLAPGMRVELRGNDEHGGRTSRDVRVDAGGWTVVRWP